MGGVNSAPSFECCSDGCVGELACCVVSADDVVIVVLALACNVCA
jgi:hypothetical protein